MRWRLRNGRGRHRRNAWLALFSSSRLWMSSSGSPPPLAAMSARWNQQSRALRCRGAGRRQGQMAYGDGARGPSECVRIDHVDAGDAVRVDGGVLGQLNRSRGVEVVKQLRE